MKLELPKDLTREGYAGVKPVTAGELMECKVPARPDIIGGFIAKGGRCLVTGPAGIGKTLFALGLGAHVSMGKTFLGWDVERPRRVVYMDAEMAPAQTKLRVKRWTKRIPGLSDSPNFRIAPFMAVRGKTVDLTTTDGQRVVEASIGDDAELIIFDNYSAFNPEGGEDAQAWAPFDAYLNSLSRRGIATMLIHHAGKGRGNTSRGTTRLIAPVDTFISLGRVNGKPAGGPAEFIMHFEKTRDRPKGDTSDRRVKLMPSKERGYKIIVRPVETAEGREAQIQGLIAKGYKDREIAEKLGVNRSTVCRHRKKPK
ncbi:MAG TPA: AAA family ATPase [Usitatibacter sp.]|nr:AAA family ATPase [Usitatibacter sp.]